MPRRTPMKKPISSLLVLCLSLVVIASPVSRAQDPPAQEQNAAKPQPVANALTNKDVIDMLKAGLTAEVIVAKIKAASTNFDTSPTALSELKAANVPDDVILAMVNGPATTASSAATSAAEMVNVPDGTEVEIQLTNNASGEELKVGDVVDFTVLKPVQLNGRTIFEKDAAARAR